MEIVCLMSHVSKWSLITEAKTKGWTMFALNPFCVSCVFMHKII